MYKFYTEHSRSTWLESSRELRATATSKDLDDNEERTLRERSRTSLENTSSSERPEDT
jgi:hypothetical protein